MTQFSEHLSARMYHLFIEYRLQRHEGFCRYFHSWNALVLTQGHGL